LNIGSYLREQSADICGINDLQKPVHSLFPLGRMPPLAASHVG
jgi:hypothetical protein